MTLLGLILTTTLPWAVLHLIRHFYVHSKSRPSPNSLPLPLSGEATASRRRRGTWDISPLWLKYETTQWNTLFSSSPLSFFSFSRRRHSLEGRSPAAERLTRWGTWFYAFGAGVCVLAMLGGMMLLSWSALGVAWRLAQWTAGMTNRDVDAVKRLARRAFVEEESPTAGVDNEHSRLHALIPGITVPLSHLPVLLCGLAFSGIIHEAGHAITASLENLPILSTGLHIHLAFPTFFVAFSESTLATLTTPSRLRIATAGAWHNFVTWGILALIGSSAFSIGDLYPLPSSLSTKSSSPRDIQDSEVCTPSSAMLCSSSTSTSHRPSRLWRYLGYKNVLDRGVVITHVETDSPLYGHLPLGSVVTRLDDVRMGGVDEFGLFGESGYKRWYSHLGMTSAQWERKVEEEAGWCVPEIWFTQQSKACCQRSISNSTAHHHESEGPDSCFTSLKKTSDDVYKDGETKAERCLDPVSLFTYQHSLSRGKTPLNPSLGPATSQEGSTSKSGSAYGSRCHVACLRADGDDQEYVCARPRARVDRGNSGIDPAEEQLLRLEIEDPPWMRQPTTSSHNSDQSADGDSEDPMTREGVPPSHEHRMNPHHPTKLRPPTRILIYKGPTAEILSHVTIGSLQPRSRYFPPSRLPYYIGTSLPALLGLFWEYVARLSLSLAFFNLLPVMGLDGGAMLSCLIVWWLGDGDRGGQGGAEEYDVELLERGAGAPAISNNRSGGGSYDVTRRKEKIEKTASMLTIGLVVVVGVATLWQDVG